MAETAERVPSVVEDDKEDKDRWITKGTFVSAVVALIVAVIGPLVVHWLTPSHPKPNLRLADVANLILPFDGGQETVLDVRLENDGEVSADVRRLTIKVLDIYHFEYHPTPMQCQNGCLANTGPPVTSTYAEDLGDTLTPQTLPVQHISVAVDAHTVARIVLPFGAADRTRSYLARIQVKLDADHGRTFTTPVSDILVIRDQSSGLTENSMKGSLADATSTISTRALGVQDHTAILSTLTAGNVAAPDWFK